MCYALTNDADEEETNEFFNRLCWGHIAEEDRNGDRGDDGRLQCQVGDDNTGYI